MTKSIPTPPTSVAPLARHPETRSARSEAARATPGLRRHRLPIAVCALGLVLVGLQSQDASGAIVLTVQQQGANVVIAYSGSFDSWTRLNVGFSNSKAVGDNFVYATQGTNADYMNYGLTKVSGTWTGTLTIADSATGDQIGWEPSRTWAPLNYTAGDPIAGSMTFLNTDLTTMGFTVGDSGSWSGVAGTVNFTVGASAVPGAGLAGLASIGLAGLARRRRR